MNWFFFAGELVVLLWMVLFGVPSIGKKTGGFWLFVGFF
jgi:hypothetical protein